MELEILGNLDMNIMGVYQESSKANAQLWENEDINQCQLIT